MCYTESDPIELTGFGPCPVIVVGRVARMIRWLVANQERIGKPDKIAVEFDCAGPITVQVQVRHKETA